MLTASQLGIVIGQTLWYFLPALIANMAPVFATRFNWLPSLNHPFDGGILLHKQPLLGANKTVRGLVVGLIFGSITALIQYWLQPFPALQLFPLRSAIHAVSWGALLGFGALFGDALKSFAKRRLAIPSGESWPPWDQIDMVLGVLLVAQWIAPLSLQHVIVAVIIIGSVMLLTSYLGKKLRIKNTI